MQYDVRAWGIARAVCAAVPGNRGNLTPTLALTYNSSGGPSAYGYGWDLPLGRIQRCGKFGVLSCSDPAHREDFVLSLPGGNVECTRNTGDNRCYPTIEESFLRIVYSPSEKEWDVWDRSGIHYTFGMDANSRLGSDPNDALFTPGAGGTCSYTFAWLLSRIEDPNGNYVEITWTTFGGASQHAYPTFIHYGANFNSPGGGAPAPPHMFQVAFDMVRGRTMVACDCSNR